MRVRAPALLAAAALVVSACGGDKAQAPSAEPNGAVSREGTEEEARYEQLGLTVQVPDRLLNACSRAAEETQLKVVYCPPVVPAGAPTIEYASGDLSFSGDPPSYGISMRSAGVDDPGSGGHWAVEAAAASADLEDLIVGGIRRARETPDTERIQLLGTPATVLRVQQAANTFHKGHVVVLWRFRNADYLVSLHGHDNEHQARLVARGLVRQMKVCASAGTRETGDEVCEFMIEAEGEEESRESRATEQTRTEAPPVGR